MRVRVGDQDVVLDAGRYFVGRGPECHVRIDHPRVSRRHALITVSERKAFLQDLDSANGVFVHGKRIEHESVELEDGMRILIAEVEIVVGFDAAGAKSPNTPRLRTPPLFEPSANTDAGAHSTHTTDFFELMSKIVARMLAEGRVEQATSILQARLEIALEEARSGRILRFDQVRTAMGHALMLAERTRDARWVAYVIELLTVFGEVPGPGDATRLEAAIRATPGLPAKYLDAYAESLKRIEDPLHRMEGINHARAFQRAALAARRST